MSTFFEKYLENRKKKSSLLCVGLDPDPQNIPEGYDRGDIIQACTEFLGDVIRMTRKYALAYKANCAFFEALGPQGALLFKEVLEIVRREAPGALFIADAKRGDVPHSATAYAKAFFEELDCDALTVNPYMGLDCIEAFCAYDKKAVMVLCYTSNPGASFFQNLGEPPLYLRVARAVAEQEKHRSKLWLVVGATPKAEILRRIREEAPGIPCLVPGIGQQGGNLSQCLDNLGKDLLINVGRSILYASPKRKNMAALIEKECKSLQLQIAKVGREPRKFGGIFDKSRTSQA